MRRLLQKVYGVYALLAMAAVVGLFGAALVVLAPTLALRRTFGRWGSRAILSAAFVPFRVRGLEHLPPGPCVVVSNHASYLDGPILTAALPQRFTFVVQDGAEDWPFIGLVIRRMGVTFINRRSVKEAARQTRALIRRLQDGESLAIFVEGTFERAPGLLAFRNGAFLMAAHAKVPIVPAVLRGTRRLYGEGQRLPRHSSVEIELFPPIVPTGAHDEVRSLRDRARAVILAHCGEPDAAIRVPARG
jgi:1-acyl-sn-glycerol-3-phosphate acyltransferase